MSTEKSEGRSLGQDRFLVRLFTSVPEVSYSNMKEEKRSATQVQ